MQSPQQPGAVGGAAWTAVPTAAKRMAIRLALAMTCGASILIGTTVVGGSTAFARPHQASTEGRSHQNRHGVLPRSEARPPRREAARPAAARPVPEADPAIAAAISPQVLAALQSAGARQDDGVLLFAMAWRESRCDPKARNRASTARGLMQFTQATWLEAVRDHGEAHGLTSYATALVTNRETGAITAPDRRVLAELLALRDDPRLSAALAMARLDRERASLARLLRRPVAQADLYMVHFLGPDGARRFLRALARAPSGRASDAVRPEMVAANRPVFVASDGRHRSLREVYREVQATLRAQRAVYTSLLERMDGPAAPVEVASAR